MKAQGQPVWDTGRVWLRESLQGRINDVEVKA